MIRCYSDLAKLKTIEERFDYLKTNSRIGEETFGFDRWLNQELYRTPKWRSARREVILRDSGNDGCYDLGVKGYVIGGMIIVHHMNPITEEDVIRGNPMIFDPEYLISCSDLTHKAVHYGDSAILPKPYIPRRPNDTIPWR